MGPLLGLVAYIWGNGRGLSQRRGSLVRVRNASFLTHIPM